MHPERFGKALGLGARQAARALLRAADAAAAPAPARAPARASARTSASRAVRAADRVSSPAAAAPVRGGGLREGSRRFGSSVLGPARRAGGVLWLEVTGSLFAIFALLAGTGVWAGRAHLRPGPGQAHELAGVAMLAVFTWFSVSNFVRASRRSRRP